MEPDTCILGRFGILVQTMTYKISPGWLLPQTANNLLFILVGSNSVVI